MIVNSIVKYVVFYDIIINWTISFLIGRKRTVNFRNRRLWRHLAEDYTIIMSRTLKVMGYHVMYGRGACFLTLIMSSSRGLCCLPSVKMQKHNFHLFSGSMCNKTIIRVGFCDAHNNHKPHPIIFLWTWDGNDIRAWRTICPRCNIAWRSAQFSWRFRFAELSHYCHTAALRWSIFQRYCSTDVKIFVVSFTFTAQKSTKTRRQNFSLDCQVVFQQYSTPGHQNTHFAVSFVSIKPCM